MEIKNLNNKNSLFKFDFYLMENNENINLTWDWVFDEFDLDKIYVSSNPKGIILISNDNQYYAATFGHSYYYINLYSDKNWAFNFAKKVEYSSIKSMEVNIPNSVINKRINSYINYPNFEVDSGESLSKVDANLKIDKKLDSIIHNRINIGNSLKFITCDNNLENIACTINYINYIIDNEDIKNRIPRFNQVKDKNKIKKFDNFLEEEISNSFKNNEISYRLDLNIFLTNFGLVLSEYNEFILQISDNKRTVDSLEINDIKDFISSNDDKEDILKNFKVSIPEINEKLDFKSLIFFDYFDEHVVLIEGNWYEYNEDYLEYLEDSMNDLDIEYDKKYSFYTNEFFEFLKNKYKNDNEEFDCTFKEFNDKEYVDVNKYFTEDNFNKFLETMDYFNFDQKIKYGSGYKIEITDLYKDETIYAVKIGNSASSLSYVVDQSLIGLKYIHEGKFDKIQKNHVKNVCIWLILERNSKISSLNDLNIIILKNKLDYWKKQIRLLGYVPIIRINYKSKNKNL